MKENENTTQHNIWNTAKARLRINLKQQMLTQGKRKGLKSIINVSSLSKLEQQQNKPQTTKTITKSRNQYN